ncbi:hypothetical protein AOQ84DRAFT_426781 [Glonium stellatum]|uniref:Uncharacterized protein n=1 Tax=Glonium stellatum TaxID=574774 RepID=A0A8E2JLZ9_9PEZI|nr:hypothetical protein AOQ84DRAFT_426781 [Glonium stellatum]
METVTEIAQKFSENSATYLAERIEYSSVHSLLLFWKENDVKPEDEINALKVLFEEFNYTVSLFPIPVDGTQLSILNLEISRLVANRCNRPDTLVIVYYAGHCDASPKGEARWSA